MNRSLRSRSIPSLLLATFVIGALACGGDSKPADPKADAAKTSPLTIEAYGLHAEAPTGAAAKKAVVGEGVMIQGPGIIVTLEEAGELTPATLEAAKEENAMYNPEKVEEETLADGWALVWQNSGGMGTNYWVQVRREIDGKAYWCATTAAQVEQQKNALATCKSLKKG